MGGGEEVGQEKGAQDHSNSWQRHSCLFFVTAGDVISVFYSSFKQLKSN